ncbi:hypothetical protein AB6A40_007078 [Gnathostoma spinigerum]|uniref:Uncharacterized protein n=1 Tax=Gnathostoma spinigerum TaxID=75299 RepID=A0ABD6EK68_9BILA
MDEKVDRLVKTINDMRTEYSQVISCLSKKIESLEQTIVDLKAFLSKEPISNTQQRSYASVVNSEPMSTSSKVLIYRKAMQEEATAAIREKKIVITRVPRNDLEETTAAADKSLVESLCSYAQVNCENVQVFRKNQVVHVEMTNKGDAVKLLKVFPKFRKISKITGIEKTAARPDYTESELEVYRKLWAECFKRNDSLGLMKWIVVGLKIVELSKPKIWQVRERSDKISVKEERNITLRRKKSNVI